MSFQPLPIYAEIKFSQEFPSMLTQHSTSYDTSLIDLHSEPIVLVCAADDNYAMPLAVMLRSVLENLSGDRKINIFIIDGGIKQDNKRKVIRSVNSSKVSKLAWLNPIDDLLANVKVSSYYTKVIFYRLLIPELLPEYSKAIYLDSDVIVNKDLGILWDIDLEGHYLLASQDLYFPTILSDACTGFLQSHQIKIRRFFNSGVLSINLEKWRTEKVGLEVIKFISQHKLLDQEGLNILLKDKWKEIDPRWNQSWGIYECSSWEMSSFSEEEFRALINNPFIIHFTSANKPWNSIGCHPLQPLFYQYLDMTAWAGWRFTYLKQIQAKVLQRFRKLNSMIFKNSEACN